MPYSQIARLRGARLRSRQVALAAILAAAGVFAVIASLTVANLLTTSSRLDSVSQRTAVGDAYTEMSLAVARAQMHSQHLIQTRDPQELPQLKAAIQDALAADARVKALGTPADRAFMAGLEARYGLQLANGVQVLNGADPTSPVLQTPGDLSVLDEIVQALDGPTSQSRTQASTDLDRLHNGFKSSSALVLGAIALGVPVLGLLLLMIHLYERKDALKVVELQRLGQAALTDGLTSLGNHRAFQEDLRREVARAARRESPVSIVMMDVDDFKETNDSQGHARGDAVLAEIGRLLTFLRGADRAYRVGGDEFALIMPDTPEPKALLALERLRTSISEAIAGVTISIGLCVGGTGTEAAATLRDNADAALYEAKHRGKNQVAVYNPSLQMNSELTAAKMHAMREVLNTGNVSMLFQPIFRLESDQLLAFEALLRLPDAPELSGPEEAFLIAQHMGRSRDLDMLCVSKALEVAARTLPMGAKIFLNLDPATLMHSDFTPVQLAEMVDQVGIERSQVVFEVTEKTNAPLPRLAEEVGGLREMGFAVALDDVGAGNSGLEMLRLIRFDYVKIDRSVILDALDGGPGRAIILAIVAFAREAGAFMIAEGIESKAMLAAVHFDPEGLRGFWIQGVQGFLFGEPRAIMGPDLARRAPSQNHSAAA